MISIVKMPRDCGPSPYARLAHLKINNAISLPEDIKSSKPVENPIYELHFDFNFHLLSETRTEADGEVLVRGTSSQLILYKLCLNKFTVDATNLP
jgi:hypothetical protein